MKIYILSLFIIFFTISCGKNIDSLKNKDKVSIIEKIKTLNYGTGTTSSKLNSGGR